MATKGGASVNNRFRRQLCSKSLGTTLSQSLWLARREPRLAEKNLIRLAGQTTIFTLRFRRQNLKRSKVINYQETSPVQLNRHVNPFCNPCDEDHDGYRLTRTIIFRLPSSFKKKTLLLWMGSFRSRFVNEKTLGLGFYCTCLCRWL